MPFGSFEDPRKGTWAGKIVVLAGKVINEPSSVRDCWLVSPAKETQSTFKVGNKKGGQANHRTHVVLYALKEGDVSHMEAAGTGNHVHRHRCGHGHSPVNRGVPVCINPWHITVGNQGQNRDDEGCKYGAYALCPHDPKCIFTDRATGKYIPCLNKETVTIGPGECNHTFPCYPRRTSGLL